MVRERERERVNPTMNVRLRWKRSLCSLLTKPSSPALELARFCKALCDAFEHGVEGAAAVAPRRE